mmetsp:Transcript_9925/g.27129  ORF Transcript_9925/g.27129 Transcript_9925/m.27129 type:complete len:268 (-) Transcript_9925:438-1241(-)
MERVIIVVVVIIIIVVVIHVHVHVSRSQPLWGCSDHALAFWHVAEEQLPIVHVVLDSVAGVFRDRQRVCADLCGVHACELTVVMQGQKQILLSDMHQRVGALFDQLGQSHEIVDASFRHATAQCFELLGFHRSFHHFLQCSHDRHEIQLSYAGLGFLRLGWVVVFAGRLRSRIDWLDRELQVFQNRDQHAKQPHEEVDTLRTEQHLESLVKAGLLSPPLVQTFCQNHCAVLSDVRSLVSVRNSVQDGGWRECAHAVPKLDFVVPLCL